MNRKRSANAPDLLDLLLHAREQATPDGGSLPVQTAKFLGRALRWASEEHYRLTSERDSAEWDSLDKEPEPERVIVARERAIIEWDSLCESISHALDTLTITGGKPVEQAIIEVAMEGAHLSGVQPATPTTTPPATPATPCSVCGAVNAGHTCCKN